MNVSKSMIIGAMVLIATAVTLVMMPSLVENVEANEIVVIQSPVSGELTVIDQPGWAWQGFGSVTQYPKRKEFSFVDPACVSKEHKADSSVTKGLDVRFHDGGNATLCGTVSWMMPASKQDVIMIHKDFHSAEAFEVQAIRRAMESAATFSGPTMSSFDSAAGRRNELLQILNDQTMNGVYKTISKKVNAKDIAGVERETTILEIVADTKTGLPVRAQDSYVNKYHAVLMPMSISGFKYEDRVEKQIQNQQEATNNAVVSAANAKKADQDALTAESQGRAKAVSAEWEQKTIAAKTIADAQAKITIAEANVKEAEAFKKAETLRGEGEAARKRLVMEADGQLDKKLEAVVAINKMYADAIKSAQPGAWSPVVMMGQGGQAGGNNAAALVDLLTARTAKDLGVDLQVRAGAAKK